MASIYTISDGTGRVEISSTNNTFLATQLTATSLDADVTIKLQHSSDNVNFVDLADTSYTLSAASDTQLVETYDFTLDTCFLYVDVGSATTGEIEIYTNSKKKEEVSGGGVGSDVNVTNDPLNVAVTSNESNVLNSTNIDAFNRLRVSQINSQADLKQIHDNLPLFYDTETVGAGASVTHIPASSESQLATTSNGDKAFIQTKQRFNYSSGKSSLILITFRNFNTIDTTAKRVGYFNTVTTSPYFSDIDGLYLESKNGSPSFYIANNGTRTEYPQSGWDDPLDGTGASGVDLSLDTETGNTLMWMDFEWLGVGQVRFGFVKEGVFLVASTIDHIGLNGVYMKSPNHSIRAELRQNTANAEELCLICATYGTEGEINSLGKILSDNMGSTHVDANNTSNTYALIGLRLATSKSDTLVDLLSFTLLAITNDNQRWEIWLNPTVAGTFTYSAVTNSSIETAKGSGSGNTVTTTGATLLASGYVNANSADEFAIESAIRLGMTIAGVQDEIVLCTSPLSSNSDVIASITWREIS